MWPSLVLHWSDGPYPLVETSHGQFWYYFEQTDPWITIMQDTGHPGNTIETLQVVSFLPFLPENPSGICFVHLYAPCDMTTVKMMPTSSRAHPQLYCFKF